MSAPRWMSIDDYLAAAGESWATVGNIRPGADHNRTTRARVVDEDQESAGTPARTTSTRTSKTNRPPRP